MVSNKLFSILGSLTEKELKLILIIIRQTTGWIDKKGKRKEKDWISNRYFQKATGLSRKSVNTGLLMLQKKALIGIELEKSTMCKFYSCLLLKRANLSSKVSEIYSPDRKILLYTKLTETKLKTTNSDSKKRVLRISDRERYVQILREKGLDKGD